MTVIAFVIVLIAIGAVVVAAGRLGTDSRPRDPGRVEPDWPSVRHCS